jgi:hypothetical protein
MAPYRDPAVAIDHDHVRGRLRVVETGDHAVVVEETLFNQRLYHDTIVTALNQAGKPYTALNAADIFGGKTSATVPRRF